MQKIQYPLLIITSLLFFGCAPAPSRRAVEAFDSVDPSGQEIFVYYGRGDGFRRIWEDLCRQFSEENPWGIRVIGEWRRVNGELWDGLLSQGRTGLVLFGQEGVAVSQEEAADIFPLYGHPKWGMEGVEPLEDDLPSLYLVKTSAWRLPYLPLLRDMEVLYINLDGGGCPGNPGWFGSFPTLFSPPMPVPYAPFSSL